MLTIDDIKEKRFEKAVFGGYDARSVDEFMDEIVTEILNFQKEKVAMQQKLQHELERNQEFVAMENSMRKALMSAQEISNDMVTKAKTQRDQIMLEVEESAKEQINTYKEQIKTEERKLESVKQNYTDFVSKVSAFYEAKTRELSELTNDLPVEYVEIPKSSSDFGLNTINELPQMPKASNSVLGYTNTHESMTENILEKFKQESFSPRVSFTQEDTVKPQKLNGDSFAAKTNPKLQISTLEFGKKAND